MRISLAEIHDEQVGTRRTFKQKTITLGRDNLRNNLVFDRASWPSVSRLHAEIRFANDRWYLVDVGSSHGTFLNGNRISVPTEIHSGSLIQLGSEGPVLRADLVGESPEPATFPQTLIDVEAAKQQADLRAKVQKPSVVELPTSVSQAPPPSQAHSSLQKPAAPPAVQIGSELMPVLICEKGSPAQLGHEFALKNETTVLGRDAAADIPIDAAGAIVSRRHAEVRRQDDGSFAIADLNSFNGTIVNDRRITQPTPLHHGDRVHLAVGGPIFRFSNSTTPPPPVKAAAQPALSGAKVSKSLDGFSAPGEIGLHTIMSQTRAEPTSASNARFLYECSFDRKPDLRVGRDAANDIQLDGLLISDYHARFIKTPQGLLIEDARSTNGVYVNGGRVSGRRPLQSEDIVQIGPFVLKADPERGIAVFDSRSRTRIDAVGISEILSTRSKPQPRRLLDQVNLAIEPNEFVGVLGPSGAGKSVLIKALNGMRRTTQGRILINNLELYQHLDSLKQSIGYVPQDDVIHRELSVYRTLYYVARLRLSRDVPPAEIDQIIGEVLDVTGLADRRDVLVSQLSGGQRKRVSIAVELLTKPSVIFLDEPTSGLDPATEERIMKLFRQIAESGHTVILTTHAMENVRLFDRVVLLLRGKLIFYGTPAEALEFVGATNFIELYNKLEAPAEAEVAKQEPLPAKAPKRQQRAYEQRCDEIAEVAAEQWRTRFRETELYRRYIEDPLSLVAQEVQSAPIVHRRRGFVDVVRQWTTLVRRYAQVLASDKWNLLILLGQAPVIGLLTFLVVGRNDPRDFPFFILAVVSIWFGTSLSARELIRERPVFERERMVNLGLFPYIASKLFVLSLIAGLQTTLLFGTLKILHYVGVMYLPGLFFGLPQLLIMMLTAMVGIALGLFISALVKTSEVATSLVPLILIPQILFAGLVTVPTGVSRIVGAAMPATWSYDEIKRLSLLDTLKPEGSDAGGPNKGHGLYQHTREINVDNVANARKQLDDYTQRVGGILKSPERKSNRSPAASESPASSSPLKAPEPAIGTTPVLPAPREINDDLSSYVSFKHPWGGLILNPAILFAMLLALLMAITVALRAKDVR